MIFSTAAEMFSSDRETVHGFVETPQNVIGTGIRAAQGLPGCHDLSGPPSDHQVSDIPEGRPIYQLSGMSALQHKYGQRIHGVL